MGRRREGGLGAHTHVQNSAFAHMRSPSCEQQKLRSTVEEPRVSHSGMSRATRRTYSEEAYVGVTEYGT